MKVETITQTEDPEKTICLAARNDYLDGWVGEMDYSEVMKTVEGDTIEEKEYNLLKRLFKRGHYGVFEHVHASFAIEGISRVTMAQVTRHRLLSFDVQSQRYVDFSDLDYTIPPSFTDKDHATRSGEIDDLTDLRPRFEGAVEMLKMDYEFFVENGVPEEDARYILPNAVQVNMVMSGNLRALMHVVNMRSKADVQHETRELAEKVGEEISEWTPRIYDIFEDEMPMKLGL